MRVVTSKSDAFVHAMEAEDGNEEAGVIRVIRVENIGEPFTVRWLLLRRE